ncbi:dihydrofolate reductase family protein [Nocardia camponoti]|uniref:Bacterial bifunctional deaminase-reductase C-terminal domain-containing protein n=1 Tax=Nocardia camponoti TaxID=1616106 RepID=A0A917QNS1_9NOCA|nr:dihydrofolate reductase family protein [Nocardia camponoti]GGK60848.1 hypothetical protein GCM10011591_36500 [Nocardia camponoti]
MAPAWTNDQLRRKWHVQRAFRYVFAATLTIDDPQVERVTGDAAEFVRELKRADGGDIWLCGGGNLAGQLVDEIDEMVIKSYPVVAGAGISAFAGVFNPTQFAVKSRKDFDSGTQVTWFERK